MRSMIPFLFLFLFSHLASAQHEAERHLISYKGEIASLELPQHTSDQLVQHFAFTLHYNEAHEQAEWVAYELTATETEKAFERSDRFVPDPFVKTGSATTADYKNSGYDRGHLAPAADMGWSGQAMKESFYYSNMSPQLPAFNRGIWKKLEEQVRDWAGEYGSVYVVTGPVLAHGLPCIGPNKVSVPELYYKALLVYTPAHVQAIAFLMPNAGSNHAPAHFVVSIDSVEHLTGLNFFEKLPDEMEEVLERVAILSQWHFFHAGERTLADQKLNSSHKPVRQVSEDGSAAVQCEAMTAKGDRCRRMTKAAGRRCWQHQ
jgi:endonuclease G